MSIADAVIGIESTCLIITFTFVVLRLYTRYRNPNVDSPFGDIMVILAWSSFAAWAGCSLRFRGERILSEVAFDEDGLGTAPPELVDKRTKFLKTLYGSSFPYITALWFVKATIITSYYRLAQRNECRQILHAITSLCFITFILAIAFNALWCIPVTRNWATNADQRCISAVQVPSISVLLGSNICTNLVLYIYPLRFVLSGSLTRQQRVVVGVIYAFSTIYIALSIARAIQIYKATRQSHVIIWTTLELTFGIAVACCTTFRVFFNAEPTDGMMERASSESIPKPHDITHDCKRNSKTESIKSLSRVLDAEFIKMHTLAPDLPPAASKRVSIISTKEKGSRPNSFINLMQKPKPRVVTNMASPTTKRRASQSYRLPSPVLPPCPSPRSAHSSISGSSSNHILPSPPVPTLPPLPRATSLRSIPPAAANRLSMVSLSPTGPSGLHSRTPTTTTLSSLPCWDPPSPTTPMATPTSAPEPPPALRALRAKEIENEVRELSIEWMGRLEKRRRVERRERREKEERKRVKRGVRGSLVVVG